MANRPLNLVWRRKALDSVLETSFIRNVLLRNLKRPQRWISLEDGEDLPMIDDMLIVSFGDPVEYFEAARARGLKNIGFFQLGDEIGKNTCQSYQHADYVLRHYYFADHLSSMTDGKSPEVLWVPNGWGRGIGPDDAARQLSFRDRRLMIFFSGFVRNEDRKIDEREEMLVALREQRIPAMVSLTGGFGQGLGPSAFAAHMGNARFAAVPGGNSPETIRLYDALELGALPVVLDREWIHAKDGLAAIGEPPLVLLKSWQEAGEMLGPYLEGGDDAVLDKADEQRLRLGEWWQAFKSHTAERVARVIDRSFAC